MALDARRDPEASAGAIQRIAAQLGIHPEALRVWVRKAEIDAGQRPGTTSVDAERIADLGAGEPRITSCERILKSPGRCLGCADERVGPQRRGGLDRDSVQIAQQSLVGGLVVAAKVDPGSANEVRGYDRLVRHRAGVRDNRMTRLPPKLR